MVCDSGAINHSAYCIVIRRYTAPGQQMESKLSVVAAIPGDGISLPLGSNIFPKIYKVTRADSANQQLQRQNFALQTKLQRLLALQQQNKQLQSLLCHPKK